MRTNYVLIDFENVQPHSIEQLADEHFRLCVFVGANQSKVSFSIAAAFQQLGARAEYIKICGNGPNALDFHIAYYIGQLVASDPSAFFHIISKDKGFDPLVQHLKSKKILIGRVKAIAEIPLVKAANSKTAAERLDLAIAKLQQLKASKPRTVKTLSSTIAALFQRKLGEEEIADIVDELVSKGYVAVVGTKVSYALPSDAAWNSKSNPIVAQTARDDAI